MKYPIKTDTIIDVTKAPYFADNSGKTDCTAILCRVFDDVLQREVDGVKETFEDLQALGDVNFYKGFENRVRDRLINVIFPEFVPPRRIIYFPAGTYLVSNTVTYTLDDLKNIMKSEPFYELTRGIHLMGESCENTVIRLADNSEGFGEGSGKAVISYTNAEGAMERERSNVSQLNTFTDLSVDCGSGNSGAIGLRFVANNSGRVENAAFYGNDSFCALQLVASTEGVFRNVSIDGFEVGINASQTSMCIFDGIRFGDVKKSCVDHINASMVFWNCKSQGAPFYNSSPEPKNASFHFIRPQITGDGTKADRLYSVDENKIYKDGVCLAELSLEYEEIPDCDLEMTAENVAFVDDYGARGDGVTDSTSAIRAAFESGRPIIMFGSGHYFVNGKIRVPSTVKLVDFMFCDMFSGERLIGGEDDALFVIDEDSDEPLYMRQVYTFEQFYGHFRFICHASKRTLVLKDIHNQASATYFNTVRGSKVYLDDCVNTVGTYSMNTILNRGTPPEYCSVIPYEFNGQQVWAYNLNPERADVEVLNNGSSLTVFGLKVEGPGTAVRTVNGGQTRVFLGTAGIGNPAAENALFYTDDTSDTLVFGSQAFAMSSKNVLGEYRCISEKIDGTQVKRLFREAANPFVFDIVG